MVPIDLRITLLMCLSSFFICVFIYLISAYVYLNMNTLFPPFPYSRTFLAIFIRIYVSTIV